MKSRLLLVAAIASAGCVAWAQVLTPNEQMFLYGEAMMFEEIAAKCDEALPLSADTRAQALLEFRKRHARILDAVAKRMQAPGSPLSEEGVQAKVSQLMQQQFPGSLGADAGSFCKKMEAEFRQLAMKSESEIAINNFRKELRHVEFRQGMLCSDVDENLRADAAKMIKQNLFRWDDKHEDIPIKLMLKGSLEKIVLAARTCAIVQRVALQRTIPMNGDFVSAFHLARQLHQSVDFIAMLKSMDRDADLLKAKEAATRYLAGTVQ